ncbi:MAG: hypothetical protein U0V70_19260 [Terriglobia bacterium]
MKTAKDLLERKKRLNSLILWGILLSSSANFPATPSPSWRLATDDTAIVISVMNDQPTLRVLRANAVPHNWLSTPLSEELIKTVEMSGVSVTTKWKYQRADLDLRKEQLTLRFRNSTPKLD